MQVIVTSCYGDTYWDFANEWSSHVRAATNLPIEIISLDGGRFQGPEVSSFLLPTSGTEQDPSDPVTIRDSERLRHILGRITNGYTCVQIDMDVRVKRDLQPILDLPYDFIMSRAFGMPKPVVKELGFVGCTGFFVAKPGSLQLVNDLLTELTNSPGAGDQRVINNWFLGLDWRSEKISIGPFNGTASVCELRSARVCILPQKAISRNDDLASSWFGNYWSTLGPASISSAAD